MRATRALFAHVTANRAAASAAVGIAAMVAQRYDFQDGPDGHASATPTPSGYFAGYSFTASDRPTKERR